MAKNFFTFFYKTTVDLIIYTLTGLTILALLPDSLFPNFPFKPNKYEVNITSSPNWNNLLVDKGELLLRNQIVGPESLAIRDDSIYTGLADGRLVEINKKTLKVREILKLQKQAICDETKLSECARILGVKFGKDGNLYAVDYFKGVFKVNLKTNEKQLIPVGDAAMGYDDMEFDPQSNIFYVSVLTTKWTLSSGLFGLVEADNTGYLLAYDLTTKKSHKLKTGMLFPNGIQLSADQKHIFVAETLKFRVLKISIENLHKAIKENRELSDTEIETFATLPGEPDNIRLDPNGDLLVALFSTRKDGKMLHDYLGNWPIVRKAIVRAVYSIGSGLELVNSKTVANPGLGKFSESLYTGQLLVDQIPKSGSLVRLDAKTGQIKQLWGSQAFNGVTEGQIDKEGDLYFGSFISPFLGRIKKQNI